ncbi:hypothetical protein HUJ05_005502 [Dendroctonus ponderosae]|nr:hypothetical protein HUJ05_005502 [Dendroctonus ponderosae]KAH1004717.1 hypothetical protein HUJ05_005502 [Dendroctonus ponderosae]
MLMFSTNGSQYCHAWPNIEWEKMDEAASIWRRFCRNTTIPAVGFISREIKLNRLLWVLCFLGGIAGTVAITLTILEDSRSESMYINIEAPVPITEIQFPGIAICEINKISKHRAVELANKLSTVSNLGRDKLLNMTRLLGNLYDYSNVGAEDLQTLQDLLDQLDGGTSDEDMIRRLASLVTPCEDLLHNCTWNSISYSCTDLFQMRFTDSGLCCVFNYVRDTPEAAFLSSGNKAVVTGPIRKFMGAGAARGLSVSIVNNLSDYFYTSMASRGALLKLFLPTDFADMPSGSLKSIIVPERSDVYVDIVGKKLNTSSTFRALPIKQSYKNGVTFCNLKNLACLSQFSSKWLRYYPLDDPRAVELSFEFEDSLLCENCLPNCADTLYDTSTSYLEFHSGSDYLNSSRVHVFSGNGQAKYYKKRVATMWFESLSTVGGILSFIMGISIINLVELAVVCAKLGDNSKKFLRAGSVDVLLEFLEVAIHTAVYLRQLYPESIFVARKKYGVAVFQAVHPEVAKYIQECLKAAGFHASKKQLKRLLVCFEADDIVADRFVVDVLAIAESCHSDVFLVELESCFRTFLLKLHSAQLYLEKIASPNATFSIRLETGNLSSLEFNASPSFEHFPWIPQSPSQGLREDAASIVPIHSLTTDCLKLQMYIEK